MHDYIASRHDQFIKDLETIVNIDSGSHYTPGVEKIVAFFQKRFSKLNWETEIYSFAEGKVPCLEAANVNPTAADTEFDFFFIGHMDTVLSAMVKRLTPGSNRRRASMRWSSWPIKFWK